MAQDTVQDMINSLKKLIESSSDMLALDEKPNRGKSIIYFIHYGYHN